MWTTKPHLSAPTVKINCLVLKLLLGLLSGFCIVFQSWTFTTHMLGKRRFAADNILLQTFRIVYFQLSHVWFVLFSRFFTQSLCFKALIEFFLDRFTWQSGVGNKIVLWEEPKFWNKYHEADIIKNSTTSHYDLCRFHSVFSRKPFF